MSHIRPDFPEPYELPVDGLRGEKRVFLSHLFTSFSELVSGIPGAVLCPCQEGPGWLTPQYSQGTNKKQRGFTQGWGQIALIYSRRRPAATSSRRCHFQIWDLLLISLVTTLLFTRL